MSFTHTHTLLNSSFAMKSGRVGEGGKAQFQCSPFQFDLGFEYSKDDYKRFSIYSKCIKNIYTLMHIYILTAIKIRHRMILIDVSNDIYNI